MYVTVCEPAPTATGLNVEPLGTPSIEKLPPEGLAIIVKGSPSIQISLKGKLNVRLGFGFIVTITESLVSQTSLIDTKVIVCEPLA